MIPPPIDPGMQDKNSNPVKVFCVAKFAIFLSRVAAPTSKISLSINDIFEKLDPNLIVTPSNPPSLIKVFDPAPKT